MDQDPSTHPQTPSWPVKGRRWPSWALGASQFIPRLPTAGPATDRHGPQTQLCANARGCLQGGWGRTLLDDSDQQDWRPEVYPDLRQGRGAWRGLAGQRWAGREGRALAVAPAEL